MSDMPESLKAALEMSGVSVGAIRDQDSALLTDVNWSVAPGDFWVIGGLQGSGKTDFLLLAGGLMAPLAGSYRFMGEMMPIFEEGRVSERLKLGLVFDGGQLFNHLTVSENIALPLRYHRNLSAAEAKPEVQKLLELTELVLWADSTPGAIGRNWQKRVGLARALISRPEVLLLDNPLAGLDLRHRAWWLNFLGELSRGHDWFEGRAVTVIATADDLRPWWKRAKQFALLKDKQFVALGSWEQVENSNVEQVRELMTR